MALDVVPQAHTADFFFAFDQDFDIDGKLAMQLMERFERFQVDVHLSFIVGSAAPKDIPVANFRLEGRRGPEFERLGRLHVVMAIEKNRRLAGSFPRFCVHERVKTGGNDFNDFEAGGT